MTGTVTIKDGTAKKYVFNPAISCQHIFEVVIDKMDAPGDTEPAIDNQKTIYHVIQVDFELIDRGTYNAGADPGTTGSVWKQQELCAAMKNQPTANDYYTLIEDDDSENTAGYNGVIYKITIERKKESFTKKLGTLLFLESMDVMNF